MYAAQPSFVLAFHGCDESLKAKLLSGEKKLEPSKNDYDWLGHGIYFWENDPKRAFEYAESLVNNPVRANLKIETPAVIGAVIDFKRCLNLFDRDALLLVKNAYDVLVSVNKLFGDPMPQNKKVKGNENDLLLRNLDCAVINTLHEMLEQGDEIHYDSVRAPFWEGDELYPNAGFREKNHIQICIRNPKCIKGYFDPILEN